MFDPNEDMKIKVVPYDDRDAASLISEGLQRYDRPELAISLVPTDQVQDAAAVINLVAEYVVENQVASGERIGLDFPGATLIVRLFDVETDTGPTQMIADAHADDPSFPQIAMSSIALMRAAGAEHQGDYETCLRILLESVARWPGEPHVTPEARFGIPYNWENARTYLRLGDMIGGVDEAHQMLQSAVQRSRSVADEVLGASIDDLRAFPTDRVHDRAQLVVARFLESKEVDIPGLAEHAGPGNVIMPSPIWRADAEGQAVAAIAMLPRVFGHRYFERPIAAYTLDELTDVVADVVTKSLEDPVRLGAAVREASRLFEDPNAPRAALGITWQPVDFLLSSTLAYLLRMTSVTSLETAHKMLLTEQLGDELQELVQEVEMAEAEAYQQALTT